MKDESDESTPLFLICIGLYLCFGLIYKFTDWLRGSWRWYHYVIIAPMGIIGLIMQIYPFGYIEAKLRKWGMFEDKAERVAFIFWIGCLVLFYFIFGPFED